MKRIFLALMIGLFVAAVAIWQWRSEERGVVLADVRPTISPVPSSSAANAQQPPPAASATPSSAPSPLRGAGLGDGMVSPDPLAFAAWQHRLSQVGSFAKADQITWECRRAHRLARSAQPEIALQRATQLGKEPAMFQARFIEAQQMVRSRCESFRQDVAADQALEGDSNAASYQKARVDMFKMDESTPAALLELARQGQLASAAVILANIPRFQGEDFKDAEAFEVFRRAVELASFNATSAQADRSRDLRMYSACLQTGVCDGDFATYALRKWPEGSTQREKALALAARMEAVFRSNSVGDWIKAPRWQVTSAPCRSRSSGSPGDRPVRPCRSPRGYRRAQRARLDQRDPADPHRRASSAHC
ncbi:hypothetical protein [Roseateles chitinivorans]|uniref:hypothetical protein n=1 Tax=Roseateles chitinivorans TaxID=2917965 RepID=UPI003D671C0A